MTCYHPIPARRTKDGPWILNPELGTADAQIPCSKCIGCRTDMQTDWVRRCVHEAAQWQENRFITFTYDDEHLPNELRPRDLETFWKRLRKACSSNDNILSRRSAPIRYLACGEYGDRTKRPHYHACVFNVGFHDERRYSAKLSESDTLTAIWGHGACKLAPFTPATAGYVAAYITKHGHRTYYDADGVVLQPPFKRQSTGLGKTWLDKHQDDLQHGYLIADARKTRVPRYYIKKLLEKNETRARTEDLKNRAIPLSNKREQLTAAEIIHTQQHQRKIRDL